MRVYMYVWLCKYIYVYISKGGNIKHCTILTVWQIQCI